MVKRSLTSSIVIKKKNSTVKQKKKSPISNEFKNYLNKDKNDKEEKRKKMNEMIKNIPKSKLDKIVNERIDGKDLKEKYSKIDKSPEVYFTIEELGGLVENKKLSLKRNSPNNNSVKIIHQRERKSKNKFTRKKPSKVKDINEIEMKIENKKKKEKENLVKQMKNLSKKEKPKEKSKEKTREKSCKPKEKPKEKTKEKSKEKPKEKSKEKTKEKSCKPIDKSKPVRRSKSRSKSRSNSRSKKSRESRKVNVKSKKISEKDIHLIDKHIRSIRSKNPDDIKKELENDGIKVSGKSKRLLKDIYLYSKICDINIKHE